MTTIFLKFPPTVSEGPLAAFSSLVGQEREDEQYALGPVRRLNLFLGANNSGKSRLLRAMSSMPVRRCIAEGAQRRIEGLVECLENLAALGAFDNGFVASWRIKSDPLVGYPTVSRPDLDNLKSEFKRLAERPGLLWAFIASLRAYRGWINRRFDNVNQTLARWKEQIDQVSEAAGREISYDPLREAEALLSEGDRNLVGDLANHPFVRIACLAERLKPIDLKTSQITIRPDSIAAFADLMKKLAQDMTDVSSPSVYIPVLRTAHLFDLELDQDEDIYRTTIRRFYGVETVAGGDGPKGLRREVFTGMDLYRRFLADRGGSRERRKRFEAFEDFLGHAFFSGKTVDIVAQYASSRDALDAYHIKVTIDESERELHHVGDGIQALIILLYPMFMADPDTWFFIDEPEIHLHPGLQRVFIETLMTNATLRERNLRYFFTTHSNHFLDPLAAFSNEVSVFSMAQAPADRFSISCRKAPSVADLDLLGVRNASVLLANCTIWVEGIVDRLYLRIYLKAYAEEDKGFAFREDIHYAFLEYGGANLKHYVDGEDDLLMRQIEPTALSNRALVISDLDEGKTNMHTERKEAFGAHGVEYITTEPCIEIENTLSVAILQQVFSGEGERLWPEKLRGLDMGALVFDESTLCTNRMGTYLQAHFCKHVPNFKIVKSPAPGSGASPAGKTLETKHKTALAKKVCEISAAGKVHWSMLSPQAQNLTKTVVAHIRRSNGEQDPRG